MNLKNLPWYVSEFDFLRIQVSIIICLRLLMLAIPSLKCPESLIPASASMPASARASVLDVRLPVDTKIFKSLELYIIIYGIVVFSKR